MNAAGGGYDTQPRDNIISNPPDHGLTAEHHLQHDLARQQLLLQQQQQQQQQPPLRSPHPGSLDPVDAAEAANPQADAQLQPTTGGTTIQSQRCQQQLKVAGSQQEAHCHPLQEPQPMNALVRNTQQQQQPPQQQQPVPCAPQGPAAPWDQPCRMQGHANNRAAYLFEPIYSRDGLLTESGRVLCTSPLVWQPDRWGRIAEVSCLRFNVTCHMNFAFLELHMMCRCGDAQQGCRRKGRWYFLLPKAPDTTVTSLEAVNTSASGRTRSFLSQVVNPEDLRKRCCRQNTCSCLPMLLRQPDHGTDGWTPEQLQQQALGTQLLFLNMDAKPGDTIKVDVQYFHPLHYDGFTGDFVLQLPTALPQAALPEPRRLQDVLEVDLSLHAVCGEVTSVQSNYGVLRAVARSVFSLDDSQPWLPRQELVVRYKVASDSVQTVLQVLPRRSGQTPFVLNLLPPVYEQCSQQVFHRDIVFVFTRSKMSADWVLHLTRQALFKGLQLLSPSDRFTMVAYDDTPTWWTEALVPATPDNVRMCKLWMDKLHAQGSVNIGGPLKAALDLCGSDDQHAQRLPTVFMIVDGSVTNERDICREVQQCTAQLSPGGHHHQQQQQQQQQQHPPRIFTVGVGPFCNHYFLKELSVIGRGMCRIANHINSVKPLMLQLLQAAQLPLLTDIQLSEPDAIDFFPKPIPDLCIGQPLLLSGIFGDPVVTSVHLSGRLLGSQNAWQQEVPAWQVSSSHELQMDRMLLEKINVHVELEQKALEAWRIADDDPVRCNELKSDIISKSTKWGIPVSNYTAMLSFQTTPEQERRLQANPDKRYKYAVEHSNPHGRRSVKGVATPVSLGSVAVTAVSVAMGMACWKRNVGFC